MKKRVDFSQNANVYDRRHGAQLSVDMATRLAKAADLRPGIRIIDVGAGTGRVAIALAAFGCHVVALDPAQAMLHLLQAKAAETRVRRVFPVAGEGARLPFAESSFEVAVLARTLYLMRDWRDVLNETVRTLKPDGQILHEWGNGESGEEWVQIREKARSLFEEAGVPNPFHPGARSESDVDEFLAGRGFALVDKVRMNGDVCLTLGDFMGRIVNGECSYTWDVPAEVQHQCLPRLEKWVADHFTLDQALPIPREFRWTIYRK